MKIAVYETKDDVPEGLRFAAQFIVGGKFGYVVVTGKTADDARAKAAEFWETHSEKAKAVVRMKPKPKEAVTETKVYDHKVYDPLDDL